VITRRRAVEIAIEAARKARPSYYAEPFTPHEWVIDAILTAGDESRDKTIDHCVKQLRERPQ